jgi:hypothetical protein
VLAMLSAKVLKSQHSAFLSLKGFKGSLNFTDFVEVKEFSINYCCIREKKSNGCFELPRNKA